MSVMATYARASRVGVNGEILLLEVKFDGFRVGPVGTVALAVVGDVADLPLSPGLRSGLVRLFPPYPEALVLPYGARFGGIRGLPEDDVWLSLQVAIRRDETAYQAVRRVLMRMCPLNLKLPNDTEREGWTASLVAQPTLFGVMSQEEADLRYGAFLTRWLCNQLLDSSDDAGSFRLNYGR